MSDIGPKIPNFLDQIQFIKYYIGNPCDVPFTAYIETALPIAGEIALVFLGIDLQAFLKRTFRPKWVRSGRHTRRGPRGRRRRGGIPEPAEMISDILDPHRDLAVNKWPFGTYMLMEAWEIVDRVFWTLFLIEMADSLLINSIIGVLELKTTDCPNIPRYLANNTFITGGGAAPFDYPVNIPFVNYSVGIPSSSGFSLSIPPGQFVAVFSGMIRSSFIGIEFSPSLVNVVAGTEYREEVGPFTGGSNEWQPFVVSMRVERGGSLQWRVRRTGGFFDLSQIRIFFIKVGD